MIKFRGSPSQFFISIVVQTPATHFDKIFRGAIENFRKTTICKLYLWSRSFGWYENEKIHRLDIPMNDALSMQMIQSFGHLIKDFYFTLKPWSLVRSTYIVLQCSSAQFRCNVPSIINHKSNKSRLGYRYTVNYKIIE